MLIPRANSVSRLSFLSLVVVAAVGSFFGSADKASAQAVTEGLDFSIHNHYLHTRALGMGGAFTAVADDYAAMFYNPAGIARIEEWQMNFQVRGMIDTEILGFVEDVEEAAEANNVAAINTLLEQNYGKHYSSRLPTLGWYWVWPRWGIAVIPLDLSLELEFHRSAGPAVQVVATQDTTIAATYARSPKWFKRHKTSIGTTIKGIYRGYFNRALNAVELAFDPEVVNLDDADEGLTVDADIGMLFTPDTGEGFWRWAKYTRPTFGFNVRNVADYGFTTNMHLLHKNSGEPPAMQRRFDVGSMWELPDWWVFKSRFAFDVRDMGHTNWTIRKGLHAGVEFKWKLFGWWQGGWRAGLNQGYLTAGFTGKLGVFQLDLATYSEEVGSSETANENRRYMVNASLDF